MIYHGLIITGTNASGKSTLAYELQNRDNRFAVVVTITTRTRRTDDYTREYNYISVEEFIELDANNQLLVKWHYHGERYGIRVVDFKAIQNDGNIPILILTPESAFRLDGFRQDNSNITTIPQFLSVYMDASDNILNIRLRERNFVDLEETRQRNMDREYSNSFIYLLNNDKIESSVNLLISLWEYSNSGGVLPARVIRLMLECGMLLEKGRTKNISGASYDLSLGDEYFHGGKILLLSEREPFLLIEPYDYAIITSEEIANFPKDICGRFDLSVGLFCQGIILSNGPQVDPGFRGPLFCLIFNTSSAPVLLKRRQHYATLEFHKLLEPTYTYAGKYKAKKLLHYLPANAAQGAINELKKELERVRGQNQNLQNTTWAILSLILAIIAVWVSLK